MNELRKQFEVLIRVLEILNEYGETIVFNEDRSEYETPCYNTFIPEYIYELNFGWYAFQEQQKLVDNLKIGLTEIWTNLDDRQSKEWIIEHCENIIKDLLK